jgi:hypothetical protein
MNQTVYLWLIIHGKQENLCSYHLSVKLFISLFWRRINAPCGLLLHLINMSSIVLLCCSSFLHVCFSCWIVSYLKNKHFVSFVAFMSVQAWPCWLADEIDTVCQSLKKKKKKRLSLSFQRMLLAWGYFKVKHTHEFYWLELWDLSRSQNKAKLPDSTLNQVFSVFENLLQPLAVLVCKLLVTA